MDFEHARFNMVEQQIRPWEVLDQDILDLLYVVRREEFVPPVYRAIAFTDLEVPLVIDGEKTGECMLAPRVEARILQSLAVRKHEHVLEVGAGSGYMAALLAHRARHVTSCEIHPLLVPFARANLARAGIRNAVIEQRDGAQPVAGGDIEVIVLSGSVAFVPEFLMHRLTVGGRLAAFVGEAPAMTAQLITRTGQESFSAEVLFETVVPRLQGFAEKDGFRF